MPLASSTQHFIYLCDSSTLLNTAVVFILPLMYSISLYHHTTMYLSILLFLGIRLVSLLGLSWTVVLWTTPFMSFGERVMVHTLAMYLEVGFLGYKAHVCSILQDNDKQLHKVEYQSLISALTLSFIHSFPDFEKCIKQKCVKVLHLTLVNMVNTKFLYLHGNHSLLHAFSWISKVIVALFYIWRPSD